MSHRDWVAFWLVGIGVAGVWAGISFLSPAAKLQRRRRKSHARVESKASRPMVRFNVRPPKK